MMKFSAATLLEAMLNCEKRKDYVTLSGHIIYNGPRVVECGDPDLVREFGRLIVRAVPAWRHEAKHGQGVLLDLFNEQNISWKNEKTSDSST